MFRTTIKNNIYIAKALFTALAISFLLVSCVDDRILFEETKVFDGKPWQRKDAVSFVFDVQDSTQKHLISCYLKNLNDYQFCNLYIQYSILDSTKKSIKNEIKDLMLYNPKTGEPFGKEEMFTDAQLGLYTLDSITFPSKGKYTILLQHHMRDLSSLDQILSIGTQIKALPK